MFSMLGFPALKNLTPKTPHVPLKKSDLPILNLYKISVLFVFSHLFLVFAIHRILIPSVPHKHKWEVS